MAAHRKPTDSPADDGDPQPEASPVKQAESSPPGFIRRIANKVVGAFTSEMSSDVKTDQSRPMSPKAAASDSPPQRRPASAQSKNKHSDHSASATEKNKPELERCAICMDDFTDPKQLDKCGHTFCAECIGYYFKNVKPQCPCCFTVYGAMRGTQPENGTMTYIVTKHRLPGFGRSSNGTIKISYRFLDGVQTDKHPQPGQRYHGTQRDAFLPDNREGRHVLKLLQRAFELRQTFTIGESRTTGRSNVVTWNDIHHKTNYSGGTDNFGYPDPTYLNRVRQELAAKGIE